MVRVREFKYTVKYWSGGELEGNGTTQSDMGRRSSGDR